MFVRLYYTCNNKVGGKKSNNPNKDKANGINENNYDNNNK